jgi:hypothetical protein
MNFQVHLRPKDDKLLLETRSVVAGVVVLAEVTLELLVVLEAVEEDE